MEEKEDNSKRKRSSDLNEIEYPIEKVFIKNGRSHHYAAWLEAQKLHRAGFNDLSMKILKSLDLEIRLVNNVPLILCSNSKEKWVKDWVCKLFWCKEHILLVDPDDPQYSGYLIRMTNCGVYWVFCGNTKIENFNKRNTNIDVDEDLKLLMDSGMKIIWPRNLEGEFQWSEKISSDTNIKTPTGSYKNENIKDDPSVSELFKNIDTIYTITFVFE